MQTITQRLFRTLLPGVLVSLFVVGVVVDRVIADRLEEEFDTLLMAKSRTVIALSEFEDEGFSMEDYSLAFPEFAVEENAEYFQIQNERGDIIYSSESLPNGIRLDSLTDSPSRTYIDLALPDGRAGRVRRTRYLPGIDIEGSSGAGDPLELDPVMLGKLSDAIDAALLALPEHPHAVGLTAREPLVLSLAISREGLDELLLELHGLLVAGGLVLLGSIAWISRRRILEATQPLRSMAEQVETMDIDHLHQRIQIDDPVLELEPVVRRTNLLLERLDQAFQRERRFSGDVAHELRTPLTELLTLVEVKERWPDDPAVSANFLDDVAHSTRRMQRIVETLLEMSRAEAGLQEPEPLASLDTLVSEAVERLSPVADVQGVRLSCHCSVPSGSVAGRDEWPLILLNLLGNAVEYSQPGTEVDVTLALDATPSGNDEQVVFSVRNAVVDLDENDLPFMFQRLWRKDRSRSSTLHSGLGLSLVEACVKRIGASIDTVLDEGYFTVRIQVPYSTAQ